MDIKLSKTAELLAKINYMKKQGETVYQMTAGEPDFDTPDVIKFACIDALKNGKTKYIPASGLPELKQEIVKKFANNGIKTSVENIVISTGARCSLFEAIASIVSTGDEVIIFSPYWLSYTEMIKSIGAKPVIVETRMDNGFMPLRNDLEKVISNNTKLIILNSPNNPTGTVYNLETLQMIADIAVQNHIMVISDEIYEKLIYSDVKHISIASLSEAIADLTITINGFSKTYAMTGWRLGYLNAPLKIAKKISALQSHITGNSTSFVQYGALAALKGFADKNVYFMVEEFYKRRNLLCSLLQEIPRIKFFIPEGAFYVWVDISDLKILADDFSDRLLEEEKLAVMPGTDFGSPFHIRLSFACSESNIKEAIYHLEKLIIHLIKES